jgi:hypothetical protein
VEQRLNGTFNARQKTGIAVDAAWNRQISVRNVRSIQESQPLVEEVAVVLKPFRNHMLATAAARRAAAGKTPSCSNAGVRDSSIS